MKEEKHSANNDYKILKYIFALILLFTVSGICYKFINGYNLAISEEQTKLTIAANATSKMSFWVSDCYNFYNHPALFSLFSVFLFLASIAAKNFTKTLYFAVTSFCFFALSLLQATYLSIWFAETVKIKWNSSLISPDIFDALLYLCFAIAIIFQVKILYRFTREKLQAKISLK